MSQIFISYSRKDEQFVSRLVTDLDASGWNVFYDRKLNIGENYEERLSEELARSRFILVVMSPNSLRAKNVLRELRTALTLENQKKTTVMPVLITPCDPDKLQSVLGPKIYADFTTDYQSGLTELETALSELRKTNPPEENPEKSGGRKLMPITKQQGIVGAVIAGVVALIGSYWQFVYKPAHEPPTPSSEVQYAARVMDSATQQVIKGAKVSVDTQGAPQVYYSDSEGVFYLKLPGTANSAHIVVDATGYERFDRNISLSRTGVEEIRLTATAPKESSTSKPTPTQSRRSANANQGQANSIDRILKSSPSNRAN